MGKCIKSVIFQLCSLTQLATYHVITCIFTNNTMQPLKNALAETRMNLQIILRAVSQKKKDKYAMTSRTCGI